MRFYAHIKSWTAFYNMRKLMSPRVIQMPQPLVRVKGNLKKKQQQTESKYVIKLFIFVHLQ